MSRTATKPNNVVDMASVKEAQVSIKRSRAMKKAWKRRRAKQGKKEEKKSKPTKVRTHFRAKRQRRTEIRVLQIPSRFTEVFDALIAATGSKELN